MKKFIPFLILLFASCGGNPVVKENKKTDTTKHESFKIKMTGVEKMLSEKLVDVPTDSNLDLRDTIVNEFRFVLNDKFIVLEMGVDTNLATGNPIMASEDREPTAVVKNCSAKYLNAKEKSFQGKQFHIICKDGKQFDARISNLKVLVEYFPNYGNGDELYITHPEDTLGIARQAWWNASPFRRMLVGEMDTTLSDEDSLLGAIPFVLPAPEFYKPYFSTSLQGKADEDVKTTIQYQALQKKYVNSDAVKKLEGEWIDDKKNKFFFSGKSKTGTLYSSLCMNAGEMCDEGFYGELTTVWKNGTDKNELEFCYPGFYNPVMYFDLDGDGIPEIFAYDFSDSPIVLKKVNGKWKILTHIYIDDERCNC